MGEAFICDAIRTPIGRYAGALSSVRADDLAAIPLKALIERNRGADWTRLDDVIMGCANQAGEDNRNVARMAVLLSGLPVEISAATVNRLCGSGMEAISEAARAIKAGDADFMLAGGVESMSRAPFVFGKSQSPFGRDVQVYDTTLGWRFVNPQIRQHFGVDSMAETADNVAADFKISREDQDAFAYRSQMRARQAMASGALAQEIVPVTVTVRRETLTVANDEHPRPDTSLQALAKLPALAKGGTVTAGNASGINDGACAVIVASEAAVKTHALTPRARVLGAAAAGVPPRIMGIGPVPATRKLLERTGFTLGQIEVIELNEAFAAQALAVLRQLGLPDDAEHLNPNGGAIALGHPLGMSGARLVTTAIAQLHRRNARYALCTMCIGVGQGIAMLLERV
jgi:acetyl-CoA acyltransferase